MQSWVIRESKISLARSDKRGEKSADCCVENEKIVLNTWFWQPPRRTWTWKSLRDRARNQIDYISINERFRNAVKTARTYPGADCNSDHVPIVINMTVQLRRPKKKKLKPKIIIKLLKRDSNIMELYSVSVRNKFEKLQDESQENTIQLVYDSLSSATEWGQHRNTAIGNQRTEAPLDDRGCTSAHYDGRKAKGRNDQLYRNLNNAVHQECRITKERWMDESVMV